MNENNTAIEVSIVDDDESFAATLAILVDGDPTMHLTSRYSDGSEAAEQLPKVRLIDLAGSWQISRNFTAYENAEFSSLPYGQC